MKHQSAHVPHAVAAWTSIQSGRIGYSHKHHCVHLGIFHVSPNRGAHYLDFLVRVPYVNFWVNLLKQGMDTRIFTDRAYSWRAWRERLQSPPSLGDSSRPQLLSVTEVRMHVSIVGNVSSYQMLIRWPSTNRHNELLSMDILEVCVFQVLLQFRTWTGILASFKGSINKVLIEFLKWTVVETTVRTYPIKVEVDKFCVAACLCVTTTLSDALRYDCRYIENTYSKHCLLNRGQSDIAALM